MAPWNCIVRWAFALTVAGLVCGGQPGFSQTSTKRPADGPDRTPANTTDDAAPTVKYELTPKPIIDAEAERTGRVLPATKPAPSDDAVTVRPDRPEQNDVSESIKEQLIRFEEQKRVWLEQRALELRKLLEKYNQSTEEDRRKIREQFKDRRDRWIEISKERRVEEDVRQRALEAKLQAHQELLQQAREAKEQAVDEARENRRGRD